MFKVALRAPTFYYYLKIYFPCFSQENRHQSGKIVAQISDIYCLWQRWIVAAIFVVAHCLITFAMPVPNCPTGMHENWQKFL